MSNGAAEPEDGGGAHTMPHDHAPHDDSLGHAPHGGETHGDLRAAEEAALGPVDWAAWRAGILGVAVAALVVLLFYVAAYGS
jgi:hypothetical protein